MTESTTDKWAQPQKVSEAPLVFSAVPHRHPQLLPSMKEIPRNYPGKKEWHEWQSDWFFNGKVSAVYVREGVDAQDAIHHLAVLQGSYGIPYEHKEDAVAWLASKWFTGIADDDEEFDNE